VEDPSSPFYNTITKRSEIGSVEADDMRSSPFYRSGLFVDYPSDRATRRGSCILIHIWSDVGALLKQSRHVEAGALMGYAWPMTCTSS
jgi:hypothetical protein